MKEKASPRVNILFTSVGRRVELLQAYRRAYEALDLVGNIVATDIDALAPGFHAADKVYLVPRVDEPGYVPALAGICEKESIDLVFPLIDPDIPVLAHHRAELERHGARVLVLGAHEADITRDKWLTQRFFDSIQVPVPRSWLAEDFNWPDEQVQLFIKPRVGSAGKNGYHVADRDDLAYALKHVPDPIIQEFVDGPEITNDVICSPDGEIWSVVSRQRIEVRWGEVAKGKTVHNAQIMEHCVNIARALKAAGPITVQCMLPEGADQPLFTEINARYGGGHPLAIAAGASSPHWYLAYAAGMKVEPKALGSYQDNLHITRYDQSYFVDKSQYEHLKNHRL